MRSKTAGILILINLIIISACSMAQLSGENEISVSQVKQRVAAGDSILLLDVRTGPEYEGQLGHVDSALLIPLAELDRRIGELEKYRDLDIIVICRSGNRSGYATRILREKGFNAFNMTGGMIAWHDSTVAEKEK